MTALARIAPQPAPQPASAAFAADVLAGRKADPKTLPAKYFYDSAGSRLFERITQLPEYYPTRTELGILETHAADIARLLPAKGALIEFGSGSSTKASILLRAAPQLSKAPRASERRRLLQAVRAAGGAIPAGRFLPRLDHRQFRAARGVDLPAQCRPHPRPRRGVHRRRRPRQGPCRASRRL